MVPATSPELGVRSAGRLEFIDAIRGIASFLVVIHHSLEVWAPSYAEWSIRHVDLGRAGISAFFMVSGYVVGLTLTHQSARVFLIRRFWRLYPVYWFAVVAYLAELSVVGTPPDLSSVTVILANALMVQGFLGLPSFLGPAWTLGLEIAFYAQSIVAKLLHLLVLSQWAGIGWYGLFTFLCWSNQYLETAYSAVAPLMIATASCGFAWYRWDAARRVDGLPLIVLVVASLPVTSTWLSADLPLDPLATWSPVGFTASYYAGIGLFLVAWLMRSKSSSPTLLWLGTVSYALYLLHPLVILATFHLLSPPVIGATLAIAGSVLAAWAAHLYLERPSLAVGRRLTAPNRVGVRE